MRRIRYVFSRMLTDQADLEPIQSYMDRYKAMSARHEAEKAKLGEEHADLIEMLRQRHKAKRGLTIVVDPQHMTEHDVVFMFSTETEEYDAPDVDERSVN